MNQKEIWRLKRVINVTGLSRTSIYNYMKEGSFPRPHKIGARSIGWNSHEVMSWVNAKLGGQSHD